MIINNICFGANIYGGRIAEKKHFANLLKHAVDSVSHTNGGNIAERRLAAKQGAISSGDFCDFCPPRSEFDFRSEYGPSYHF